MSARRFASFDAIRRFAGASGGNVAIIFAAALIPVVLAAGTAIDFGRGNALKVRLQAALDATALMVAQSIGTMPVDTLIDQADDIFEANFVPHPTVTLDPLQVTVDGQTISIAVDARIETTIMALGGIDFMEVGASTQVIKAEDSYEVVLVLDNTGSMSGQKIRALQEASELLVNNLFGEASVHPLLTMGVVPFSHAVNVGSSNKNASWMDTNARNPIHWELFDEQFRNEGLTRFDLYSELGESWPGCVEARKYPYDINDTAAGSSNPDTLFVPYFAPDEPGDRSDPDSGYYNSYIDDEVRRRSSDEEKQFNTEKYLTARRVGNLGPDYQCTAKPILALTNNKSRVMDAIDDMSANGYTNITEGLMWGLRVISPGEPFAEGKDYDTEDHHKVIILLTDGRNQYPGNNTSSYSNINKSQYGPYGYMASGRLVNSNRLSTIEAKMNERTAEACDAVKDEDIELFTITFQVSDSNTANLMRNCATEPDMYYNSPSTSTLNSVFKAIAARITELRISR